MGALDGTEERRIAVAMARIRTVSSESAVTIIKISLCWSPKTSRWFRPEGMPIPCSLPKTANSGLWVRTLPENSYRNLRRTSMAGFRHGRVSAVSCGAYHSVVMTVDGMLYVTGQNDYGQSETVPKRVLPSSFDVLASERLVIANSPLTPHFLLWYGYSIIIALLSIAHPKEGIKLCLATVNGQQSNTRGTCRRKARPSFHQTDQRNFGSRQNGRKRPRF